MSFFFKKILILLYLSGDFVLGLPLVFIHQQSMKSAKQLRGLPTQYLEANINKHLHIKRATMFLIGIYNFDDSNRPV